MKAEDFENPMQLARVYFAFVNSSGYGGAKYIVPLCEALAKERNWNLTLWKSDVEQEWTEEQAKTKAMYQEQEEVKKAKQARNFEKKYGHPPPVR